MASTLGTVVLSTPSPAGAAGRKRGKANAVAPAPRPELPADKLAKLRNMRKK